MSLSTTAGTDTEAPQEATLVESSRAPGGVTLINPYRTSKHSTTDLVALAREIEKGDSYTRACVGHKLQVIADQVRYLQEQARQVLQEAKLNTELTRVACNFVKVPGNTYHLYRRPSGQQYFSMISPVEWGSSCPHEYLGGFRLEADYSWTPDKELNRRDNDQLIIDRILTCSTAAAAITD